MPQTHQILWADIHHFMCNNHHKQAIDQDILNPTHIADEMGQSKVNIWCQKQNYATKMTFVAITG